MLIHPVTPCNKVLAAASFRCNTVRVKSIRVPLSAEELATLDEIRALGFSSHAEILRCATLAWADAAARLPEGGVPDGADENLLPNPSPLQP